ncbi:MAG: hypothetical protein AAF480_14690 [Actinomycetota bacterium]
MRRGGSLVLLTWLVAACSSDEDADSDGFLGGIWDGIGDFFDGVLLWTGLFLLFVLIVSAALILPATWLRGRFGRPDDREHWEQ